MGGNSCAGIAIDLKETALNEDGKDYPDDSSELYCFHFPPDRSAIFNSVVRTREHKAVGLGYERPVAGEFQQQHVEPDVRSQPVGGVVFDSR
jgi:hypothetical protein